MMTITNLQSLTSGNVGCMSPLPQGENGASQMCLEFLTGLLMGSHPNPPCSFSRLPAQGLVALQVAEVDRMLGADEILCLISPSSTACDWTQRRLLWLSMAGKKMSGHSLKD